MPFGIQNIGASCYINSIIQCIHTNPVFKKALTDYTGQCEVTVSLRDINVPKLLELMPQFKFGEPSDPHEFILMLIDHLEKSLGKDMFYGTVQSKFVESTGKVTITNSEFGTLMFHDDSMDIDKPDYIIDSGIGKFSCKQLTYTSFPTVLTCLFVNPIVMEPRLEYMNKKLTGCVVHLPGHYMACITEGDKWFLIDDDKIHEITSGFKAPIYIAFYS